MALDCARVGSPARPPCSPLGSLRLLRVPGVTVSPLPVTMSPPGGHGDRGGRSVCPPVGGVTVSPPLAAGRGFFPELAFPPNPGCPRHWQVFDSVRMDLISPRPRPAWVGFPDHDNQAVRFQLAKLAPDGAFVESRVVSDCPERRPRSLNLVVIRQADHHGFYRRAREDATDDQVSECEAHDAAPIR